MKLSTYCCILGLLCFSALLSAQETTPEKLAPFTAVRWNELEKPLVEVEGIWYEWLKINDIPVEDIIASVQQTEVRKWKKRVSEDLVEVLEKMGRKTPKPCHRQCRKKTGESTGPYHQMWKPHLRIL